MMLGYFYCLQLTDELLVTDILWDLVDAWEESNLPQSELFWSAHNLIFAPGASLQLPQVDRGRSPSPSTFPTFCRNRKLCV